MRGRTVSYYGTCWQDENFNQFLNCFEDKIQVLISCRRCFLEQINQVKVTL